MILRMTGNIDLEPKMGNIEILALPVNFAAYVVIFQHEMEWGGCRAVSLGTSTRLVQPPEKARREQEVRDRLNGSLLINFRFFSPFPTLDAMQYTEEQQQRSHTHTCRVECVSEVRGT